MALKRYEIHDKALGYLDTVRAYGYRLEGDQFLFFGPPLDIGDRKLPGPILRTFQRQNTRIIELDKEVK